MNFVDEVLRYHFSPNITDPSASAEGDEGAICRGCRRELSGKAYSLGGPAFHPITKEQVKVNHYGGFVCSEKCDTRVCKDMESSMPGAGKVFYLSDSAARRIRSNWREVAG